MNGVGLITVGRLLGHRKRRTTAIYAHLDDAARQDAAAQAVAVIAGAMGYRTAPPPLPDEADGDGDGATPDTPPAGDAEAAQPPPPGSAERPINSLRIVRIQDQALRAFRQSRGDIRQAATRNAFGYPHRGLAQRILRQMRVARRRLDLRVSGQVLFGAEPWPVGLWQCKTLARRSASNNKQLLSLRRL